jgi:AcrR family transcriptional regulator
LCRTASEENPRCLARHSSIPSRHENDPPCSARGVSGGPASRVLREITDSAGANVASVSYHFGSLQALCDAAIEQALEQPAVVGAAQALRRDQATARAPGRERIPWARSRCVAGDHCDDAKRVDHIVPMLQHHDLARREYPVAAQSN